MESPLSNIFFEFSDESGTVAEANKLGLLEVRFEYHSRGLKRTKSNAEPHRVLWTSLEIYLRSLMGLKLRGCHPISS